MHKKIHSNRLRLLLLLLFFFYTHIYLHVLQRMRLWVHILLLQCTRVGR